MKMTHKMIIAGGVLFVVAAASVYLIKSRQTMVDQTVKEEEVRVKEKVIVELDPTRMSRISFFNSGTDRVSLAIPDWWEGKYRLSENNDMVVFEYIDSTGGKSGLFVVKKYPDNTWSGVEETGRAENEVEAFRLGGTVYTYDLSPEKTDQQPLEEEYLQMRSEVSLIMQTMR